MMMIHSFRHCQFSSSAAAVESDCGRVPSVTL